MSLVAIHQPNYAPWLGFFYKLARSDVFVFLDDAQFSKGSYTNRVKILGDSGTRWLTVPITGSFGQSIAEVQPVDSSWTHTHLETLWNFYRKARAFKRTWHQVEALYGGLPQGSLAELNEALIRRLSVRLGVTADFRRSSELNVGSTRGDDRLVAIVQALAPTGTYLSGKGGAGYQSEEKFSAKGLRLEYADFELSPYDQGGSGFNSGLSVLDAAFHLGWDGAAALVQA